MNKKELSEALIMAQSDKDLSKHIPNLVLLDGYALRGFDTIHVPLLLVACLIRMQCINLDGSIDAMEFSELAVHGRTKFQVYRDG